jgi:hypothetical protein
MRFAIKMLCAAGLLVFPIKAVAGDGLDIMSVKTVALKHISPDLDNKTYGYTFLTDKGHGLEIRWISPDERQVLMTVSYDPAAHKGLQSHYQSWFVKLDSEAGRHLILLLKENLKTLPDGSKGVSRLAYLIRSMEQRSFPDTPDLPVAYGGENY